MCENIFEEKGLSGDFLVAKLFLCTFDFGQTNCTSNICVFVVNGPRKNKGGVLATRFNADCYFTGVCRHRARPGGGHCEIVRSTFLYQLGSMLRMANFGKYVGDCCSIWRVLFIFAFQTQDYRFAAAILGSLLLKFDVC